MAGSLRFRVSPALIKIVQHSRNALTHRLAAEDMMDPAYHRDGKVRLINGKPDYANIDVDKIGPMLLLVADYGVYVMSNGHPGIMSDGQEAQPGVGGKHLAVYAEKMNPAKDADFHARQHEVMGPSDCSLSLDLRIFEDAIRRKAKYVDVHVTPQSLRAEVKHRASVTATVAAVPAPPKPSTPSPVTQPPAKKVSRPRPK
jgi:hypothetical protein